MKKLFKLLSLLKLVGELRHASRGRRRHHHHRGDYWHPHARSRSYDPLYGYHRRSKAGWLISRLLERRY